MPKYKEGDENKYFPTVIAALIVIAIAFASFITSLVKNDIGDLDLVNPDAEMAFPDGPPNLIQPEFPPE